VNSGEQLPVQAVSKNELTRCRVKLLQETVLDRFAAHKTLGELILIDRISHATAACGVVESVDTEGEQGAVFEDGTQSISLPLFDGFYYHKDLQTIVRHSAPKVVYRVGEPLPLRSECCRYPDDFDVLAGGAVVQIRHGKFAGIGSRTEGEQSFLLLDGQGFALDQGNLLPFETYRRIGFWEDSSKA
ncbi:MAG: sulfate adenylyltransferase, partial [Intestinibacillus sp.]